MKDAAILEINVVTLIYIGVGTDLCVQNKSNDGRRKKEKRILINIHKTKLSEVSM